jgi:predicted RNA-binding Zn ribbon-like protein
MRADVRTRTGATRVFSHVRALTWGADADLDFLEYLGARLNSDAAHRIRFLHFSGRRPDPELQAREHVGSPRREARQAAQTYGALCAVEAILTPSMPLTPAPSSLHRETRHRFARLEQRHQARLALAEMSLMVGGPVVEITHATYSEGDPLSEAVFTTWMLLGLRDRDRLRRCARCGAWFVDRTRSKRMVYCSTPCHDAAWTRDRRRAARHGEYRERPRKGRDAHPRTRRRPR